MCNVFRRFRKDDPLLLSVAVSEKHGNPIQMDWKWYKFVSFRPIGDIVEVELEPIGDPTVDPDKELRRALSNL